MIAPVTAARLVQLLRRLNAQLGPEQQAIIRTTSGCRMVDWRSFPGRRACDLPGLPVGQAADFRYATDGKDGLHAHAFNDGRVEFHLDLVDGCGEPVEHCLRDTELLRGTVAGLVAGALLAIFVSPSAHVALGLVVGGAAAGAVVGAHVPRRTPVFYELSEVLAMRVHQLTP